MRTSPEQAHVAFAVYEWYFSVDGQGFGFYGPCQGHVYGECETATDPRAFVVAGPGGEHMGAARVNAHASQITFPIPREFPGAARGSVVEPLPATTTTTGRQSSRTRLTSSTFRRTTRRAPRTRRRPVTCWW